MQVTGSAGPLEGRPTTDEGHGVPAAPPLDVRRGRDRARTTTDGIETAHSFSFGRHYDVGNTSHGPLILHDLHALAAGAGFAEHPHRGVEIVTWVLEGALVHRGSTGDEVTVPPGTVQRLSAGTGVRHSESAYDGRPARFVQMWVLPDESGATPGYEMRDVADALRGGDLVPVASGLPRHRGAPGARLGTRGAALHVARLPVGSLVAVPDAPRVHLYVARGTADLEGAGPLGEGDAVRLTGGGQRLLASGAAEVLVWELHTN